MIRSLQAGRAIAALAVVSHHSETAVQAFLGGTPDLLRQVLSHGFLGVDFFFVLSGFIIYYTNNARVSDVGWSVRYAQGRAARIFVPYLPVGIAIGLVYHFLPTLAGANRIWDWFATLTLFPVGAPALSVAWTLQHELFFYAFAWITLLTGKLLPGSLVWAGVIIAAYLLDVGTTAIPLQLINLEFLFGIFAAWCFVADRLRLNALLIAAGSISILGYIVLADRTYSLLFGLGLSLILLPTVRFELAGRLVVGRMMMMLGAASYAIYLVHNPLISLLVRFLAAYECHWAVGLSILALLSVLTGILYHLMFERPALEISRSIAQRRRTA